MKNSLSALRILIPSKSLFPPKLASCLCFPGLPLRLIGLWSGLMFPLVLSELGLSFALTKLVVVLLRLVIIGSGRYFNFYGGL